MIWNVIIIDLCDPGNLCCVLFSLLFFEGCTKNEVSFCMCSLRPPSYSLNRVKPVSCNGGVVIWSSGNVLPFANTEIL